MSPNSALIKGIHLQKDVTTPFEDARDGLSVGERWDVFNNYSGPTMPILPELCDPGLWHLHSFQMRLMQDKTW